MKIRSLTNKTWQKIVLVIIAVFFSLLLFKDVFSTRTLIPNLEPYPDSIHYINPALSLLKGYGLVVEREGRVFPPSVPPLYSLILIPAFLIMPDARMFYFVNIILAFTSLFLLFKILQKIIDSALWIGFLLFLYITNYFIYWYPTIPMAENLTMTLFLGLLLILLKNISSLNLFLTALLSICLYLTKYASLPLVLSFIIIFVIKIISEGKSKEEVFRDCLKFLAFLLISFLPFYFYEFLVRDTDIISSTVNSLLKVLNPGSSMKSATEAKGSYFSTSYFPVNSRLYLGSLLGKPMRFLWDNTPMVNLWMGVLGLVGLFAGLVNKKLRTFSLGILLSLICSILFLANFYVADGRYFYHAIPSIIIGIAILLSLINPKFNKRMINLVVIVGLILFTLLNFQRLKYQIALNFRHAETPWYYVSVLSLNDYFKSPAATKLPIVISALPPYYVDFFSNKNYTLLPLSRNQEFPSIRETVWGENDYSDLIKLYKKYLAMGYVLYINNYGLGNEQYLHNDYDNIASEFKLEKVNDGCDGACNTYRLILKQ